MTKTDITLANDAFELLDPFVRAGWTLDCAVFMFDGVGLFFDNGAAATFKNSEYRISEYCEYSDPAPLGSMRRVQRPDGALRVRIHPERVPFTVGDVFVNRGGADLAPCVCAQVSEEEEEEEEEEDKNANKPVVAFKIDRDILDRKELSFNVI